MKQNRKTESGDSGEFSNSRNREGSPEILFGNELLEMVKAAHMLTDVIEQIGNRIEKIEDRLEDADLEDITDRLEIVEDADADSRIYEVDERVEDAQQQIDILIERVNELSLSREEKSHD